MRVEVKGNRFLWLLGGALAGVGYIIGAFYLLIARKGSERWLGLLYFAGPIGSLIMYLLLRNDKQNSYLKDMALYLLYGFIMWIVIAIPLGLNPFYQIFGYVHGWLSD